MLTSLKVKASQFTGQLTIHPPICSGQQQRNIRNEQPYPFARSPHHPPPPNTHTHAHDAPLPYHAVDPSYRIVVKCANKIHLGVCGLRIFSPSFPRKEINKLGFNRFNSPWLHILHDMFRKILHFRVSVLLYITIHVHVIFFEHPKMFGEE